MEIKQQMKVGRDYMSKEVEEKMAKVFIKLRDLSRYHSILFTKLKRQPTTEINTMGVNKTTLYYNEDFVKKQTLSKLIFVGLHEMSHFALMHTYRVKDKDQEIFNIACDLYVNKLLCEMLNKKPGEEISLGLTDIKIPTAKEMLYSEDVDTKKDSVEKIYFMLIDKVSKDENGRTYITQPDNGGTTGNQNSNGNNDKIHLSNLDSNTVKVDITDRMSEQFSSTGSAEFDRAETEAILRETITQAKIMSEAYKGIGTEAGFFERLIEEQIAPKVRWEKLVKKYLIEENQRESSFHSTDRRMTYQEAIFPGIITPDNTKLDKIKVCIDTSGSISEEMLGVFLNQLKQLLKKYKCTAEIITWDTKIQNRFPVESVKSIKNMKVSGFGGTNPNCLFEYFESKQCKTKPSLVIIFTDGCIVPIEDKFNPKRKYKNTIWVVHNDSKYETGLKEVKRFGKMVYFDTNL